MIFMKKPALIIGLFIAILVGAACNFPTVANTMAQEKLIYTQAAHTIVAQLTQSVIETFVAQKTQEAVQFNTQIPTQPADPTATTGLPTLTNTPLPPTAANTPIPPTFTSRPLPCDWAQYVGDVTIEDGEIIPAGQGFYKIWRLKNIGACTWTTDYDLVFVYGDRMGAVRAVPLPYAVPPGGTIDVGVYLYAPEAKGIYTGYWKLRNEAGYEFGIGPNANREFWVEIVVQKPAGPLTTPFDLVANYCLAKWSNDHQTLPCPGSESSSAGFVIRLKNPWLEKGGHDDEPALWMHPEFIKHGSITGQYPPVLIQDGDRFRSAVGCLKNAEKCNVVFSLYYSADGGTITNLGTWTEVYDKAITPVNIDLSFLKGKIVVFYLVVDANGSYKDDDAFWLAPSIY